MVQEPQYRSANQRIRPFAKSAGISQRGCSRLLQRAMTDFGADLPYAKAMDNLVEHYGIVLAESPIRRVTQKHAQTVCQRSQGKPLGLPSMVSQKRTFIVEMDGTMVPTVKADASQTDKRKGKSVQWQEAKVGLAHVQGSKELTYAATLLGDVDTAGKQLRACAKRAGFGKGHRIHGVGDGAPWIAHQIKERFGGQSSYLVDFFDICDYLSAAALAIHREAPAQQQWLQTQKERLKTQGLGSLLNELQANLEPIDTAEELAPVRRCYRYLSHRQDQLDYEGALRQDLPIGSGEIESAHRYLVQKRLKLPGSWWTPENAQHMLALRVSRFNGESQSYWATNYLYVA